MNCNCAFCRNDVPFAMPKELVERFIAGQVVIFAGAGISTENTLHAKSTLYDEIRAELGSVDEPSFPELMDRYTAAPDGRTNLVAKILHRIEYFRSYSDFYGPMTRFHRAIRPLTNITDVVTTNWDDFFEREAGFEPFVYDADLAFLDSANRRVIKIHGSINNTGSIVATTKDYDAAFRRLNNGPLGAYLKTLISSKTVIYTGYSLRDENYLRLLSKINRMMGVFRRHSYFLSPLVDESYLGQLPADFTIIPTDGGYFFEQLAEHINSLEPDFPPIISEEALVPLAMYLFELQTYHDQTADLFLRTRHPALILALSYQDGLLHALRRIQNRSHTGDYADAGRVHSLFHAYADKQQTYVQADNFWDACYCSGYKAGMAMLLSAHLDEEVDLPPLVDLIFDETANTAPKVKRIPKRHIPPTVMAELQSILATTPHDVLPHHLPYV